MSERTYSTQEAMEMMKKGYGMQLDAPNQPISLRLPVKWDGKKYFSVHSDGRVVERTPGQWDNYRWFVCFTPPKPLTSLEARKLAKEGAKGVKIRQPDWEPEGYIYWTGDEWLDHEHCTFHWNMCESYIDGTWELYQEPEPEVVHPAEPTYTAGFRDGLEAAAKIAEDVSKGTVAGHNTALIIAGKIRETWGLTENPGIPGNREFGADLIAIEVRKALEQLADKFEKRYHDMRLLVDVLRIEAAQYQPPDILDVLEKIAEWVETLPTELAPSHRVGITSIHSVARSYDESIVVSDLRKLRDWMRGGAK